MHFIYLFFFMTASLFVWSFMFPRGNPCIIIIVTIIIVIIIIIIIIIIILASKLLIHAKEPKSIIS